MNQAMATVGLANLCVGLIVAVVCYPLDRGWVKRNRWYGFRLSKSYESDLQWYAINRYGARAMYPWAGLIAISGVAAFFLTAQEGSSLPGLFSLMPVTVLIPAFQTWWWSRKV